MEELVKGFQRIHDTSKTLCESADHDDLTLTLNKIRPNVITVTSNEDAISSAAEKSKSYCKIVEGVEFKDFLNAVVEIRGFADTSTDPAVLETIIDSCFDTELLSQFEKQFNSMKELMDSTNVAVDGMNKEQTGLVRTTNTELNDHTIKGDSSCVVT